MSRNRWRWWLSRLEQIRLDIQMKTQPSKSVEPAVCPAAWRGSFLTQKTAQRAKLLAQGARRGDPGSQRSNVNQLLVHRELTVTCYQAPERRVQRGDKEGRRISPSGAVCLQWERGKSCGVPATPWRWACLSSCLQCLGLVRWFTFCSSWAKRDQGSREQLTVVCSSVAGYR